MSISSNEVIKKPDVVINPNFFLPPGVIDARYPSGEENDQAEVDEVIDTEDVLVEPNEIIEETDETNQPILLPPDNVVVVNQIIRTGENGQQVVDVILEVLDVEDSIQVDVRIAKA